MGMQMQIQIRRQQNISVPNLTRTRTYLLPRQHLPVLLVVLSYTDHVLALELGDADAPLARQLPDTYYG